MIDQVISPVRRRMIEDMAIRKFAPKTQHDYVQRVKDFAAFLGRSPDLAKHLTFMHEPRKVPVVLSPEEVARFLEAAPSVKYKAALSVAYGAGLRVSEVVSLRRTASIVFE
jgi:integrase/recombinase XerD